MSEIAGRHECGCSRVKHMAPKLIDSQFVMEEIDLEDTYCAKHLIERRQVATLANDPRLLPPTDNEFIDSLCDSLAAENVIQAKVFCESVCHNSVGEETVVFFLRAKESEFLISSSLEIKISNPDAQGKFKPGSLYRLTFSEIPGDL